MAVLLLLSLSAGRAAHAAQGARLRGLGADERLFGPAVLADALNLAALRGKDLPLVARIVVARSEIERAPGELDASALDERLERYRGKDVPVLLTIEDPLPPPASLEGFRAFARSLAAHCQGKVVAFEVSPKGAGSAAEASFALRVSAIELRSAAPETLVAIGPLGAGDAAFLQALYDEDLASYIDAVDVAADASGEGQGVIEPIVAKAQPGATLLLTGRRLADGVKAPAELLDTELQSLGTPLTVTTYAADVETLAPALKAAAELKEILAADVVRLDDKAVSLKLRVGEEDQGEALRHVLLYDLGTFGTILAYRGRPGESGRLEVELQDPTGLKPVFHDPIAGTTTPAKGNTWDSSAGRTRLTVPLADRPLVVTFAYSSDTAQSAREEVTGRTLPPVGVVIFRHQQQQAAQDERVVTTIAKAVMESHFRPSLTDPGFDVVTENTFYADREGTEWEETGFILNGTRWGAKRPPFPLLQPEKVLSLPLDLRLTKDYQYRLEGVSMVEGREAYQVRFTPVVAGKALYKGTVWIDTKTFAKLKVQAVETNLLPPVVSNEEVQIFSPETEVSGRPIYSLKSFTSRQIMLIAGRNLTVERLVRFKDFEVNAKDFAERRAASRATDNVMYRDTDEGLRYFVKKGSERVVESRPTTTATALAIGTIVDPSFDYPLPILGINYLNFNFLGKDNQLAVLFGGVLALVNVQRPRTLGGKIDLSLDLFAIALDSNDEVFDSHGERTSERLRTRPFSTGLNIGWQLDSFEKLVLTDQFRYDSFSSSPDTAPDFVTPKSTFTEGLGLGYEFRRGGFAVQASGSYNRRGAWGPWGIPGETEAVFPSYLKYQASLSKDFFVKVVHKIHLDVAYFGGHDLDRFSDYQFGIFEDNRIHGVPSSGVRFEQLAMLRGQYSLNLLDLYRVDIFLDEAVGRVPGDTSFRGITGLGLGFNLRGPMNTLLRGEIGKGFLPGAYAGIGTFVGQIMVLKPL